MGDYDIGVKQAHLLNSAGNHVENTSGQLLPSAARTAFAQSLSQTNLNGRGVVLTLNITVSPGGADFLTIQLRYVDPVSGSNSNPVAGFAIPAGAAAGTYRLIVSPGASGTPDLASNNKAYALPVPLTWLGSVSPSGASSWTYSLGYDSTI